MKTGRQKKAGTLQSGSARSARPCAVYSGTFDPPTCGHIDLIRRAGRLFPRLIVSVSSHSQKTPFFSVPERVAMLREATAGTAGIEVASFDGLLVDFVQASGAMVIVRGIRAVSDMEYEFQMAMMNRTLSGIETVFLMPGEAYTYVSSSIVKEIARHGGNVSDWVPAGVQARFKEREGVLAGRRRPSGEKAS